MALDAITLVSEPFSITQSISVSPDARTRLLLFATDIDPATIGDTFSALSADAEDEDRRIFPLTVEYAYKLPVTDSAYAIYVRLNDDMSANGDVLIRLYDNGRPSNRVRVGLGHVGGGPPDDPAPLPSPTPGSAPAITQLLPSSVTAGAGGLVLSINGSNFTASSKVLFDGNQVSATYVSDSLMLASLSNSDVANAGTHTVTVQSPGPFTSNPSILTVNNPQPVISALSPSSAIKGQAGFTLNVSGNGFVQGSTVKFNGSNRVTTFVSATMLTVQILAADVAVAGSFPLNVINPFPGGGSSNHVSFDVSGPSPTPTPTPIPTPSPAPSPSPSPQNSNVISYPVAVRNLFPTTSKAVYYRFSGISGTSVADSSGGFHTGTLSGTVTLNQTSLLIGDADPSAFFDGGKVVSPSFMPALRSGLTLSCLFKPTGWPSIGNRNSIVAVGKSAVDGFFSLSYNNTPNVFAYSFVDTAGSTVTLNFPELHGTTLDRSYHLAVTHDFAAKTVKLYLDGMLVSTRTYTQTPRTASNQPVQAGNDNVTGYIDEALVAADRVLNDTEVRSLVRARHRADQNATAFYVSPTGSDQGSGAIDSPLDLTTALRTGLVAPGQTYWLRGGTYGSGGLTFFYSILQGTASAPIIVRGYPGERATVDGCIQSDGPHVWFWGFEIMNSDTDRVAESIGGTLSTRAPGLWLYGAANKVINMVIHDTGHPGIGYWDSVGDQGEVYGTLIYHIGVLLDGTKETGSGIYSQNSVGTRYVRDVITFRNWTTGFKLYTEQGYINGFHVEGNICFDNAQWDIFVSSKTNPAERLKLINNYTYQPAGGTSNVQIGYWSHDLYSGEVRDNYFVTGANNRSAFHAKRWTNLIVDGNTFIGKQRTNNWDAPQAGLSPVTTGVRWNNNDYFHALANPQFIYNNTNLTFANWKATTGFDTQSTLTFGTPTRNQIVVRRNQYETGRANIAIYNWQNLSSVQVNLSTVGLVNGQRYEVRDAQNFYGAPVASGVYSTSSPTVNIPMTGLTAAPVIGSPFWKTVTHTAPAFGAFVVLPSGTVPPPVNP